MRVAVQTVVLFRKLCENIRRWIADVDAEGNIGPDISHVGKMVDEGPSGAESLRTNVLQYVLGEVKYRISNRCKAFAIGWGIDRRGGMRQDIGQGVAERA